MNPADLPSRPDASVTDIQPGTEWRNGPQWAYQPRSAWPLTRDFIREIPAKEKRSKMFKLLNYVQATDVSVPAEFSHL